MKCISLLLVAVFAVTLVSGVQGNPAVSKNDEKVQEIGSVAKKSSNPCVYKGRYLTTSLKKIADQFK